MREQIGEAYVGQVVKVKDLLFHSHRSVVVVEGMVRGAEYSRPSWPTHERCEVEARLELSAEELEQLQATTPVLR